MKKSSETLTVTIAATFTKDEFLKSKKYNNRKDIVSVLLKDGQSYSPDEVDELIEKYMKGKVK